MTAVPVASAGAAADAIAASGLADDWHPLCFSAALDDRPLGLTLLGEELVLWRDPGGGARLWQDRCPHRGSRLSLGRITDGALQCPYHGWRYGADGGCVAVPAQPERPPPVRARVVTYRAVERYGMVWGCIGDAPDALPVFPEWDQDGFHTVACGPYPVATSGPRIVENFLDVAHFAFVHDDILGTAERPQIGDYQVTLDAKTGVEARDVSVYQPDPYGTGEGATVDYSYRALRPLCAYLLKQSDGPRFSILLAVTPHTPVASTAFMVMAMNYAHDTPDAELIAWQDKIFDQDRPVLESQRPKRLPLDPQAEVSVGCDRTAAYYRRWLKTLGVTFGTA